jgi:molecular chaperone GrpE
MDNYDRAFQQVVPETDAEKEVEASYKNVYKMIVSALGELGVKEIETVGKEFDYEMHQAVIMRPDEDYDEGIVCEELAKGWATEDGELIRAAMVVVSQ